MAKVIETPEQLKNDAMSREYRPGAVLHTVAGNEVQLVSWPWFDGEGENRSARIMVRMTPGDCRTMVELPYFSLVGPVLRMADLDS